MKKLICFGLIFVLMLSFSACGEKKEANESTIDLEHYADLGQIPECSYKLGSDADTVYDELKSYAENADSEELMFNEYEKNGVLGVEDGSFSYFYEEEKKKDGIACIVSYKEAYGFENSEVILTIKEKFGDIKYTEEEISKDNAFFLYGAPAGTVLKYEFKKNTVIFVFVDSSLFATAIYRNDFRK